MLAFTPLILALASKRINVYGGFTLMEGQGLHVDGFGLVPDPIIEATKLGLARWKLYEETLQRARSTLDPAKLEAAHKLISNHERVLRDVTNLMPRTQNNLRRLQVLEAAPANQALREVSRILLGNPAGLES